MPPTTPQYEPEQYWSNLHQRPSLRSVGQSGLPEALNVRLYRIARRNVINFLAAHGVRDLTTLDVFDVGSGTGFWIDVWRAMGARRVDGTDLVPDAVDRLRTRYPEATFIAGDIAEPGVIPTDKVYDLVTVMNVMLHILDEERFAAAASNIAAAVRPGGHLLLAEPALTETSSPRVLRPGASSTARQLGRYQDEFEGAGLSFLGWGATTVVGANPIESAGRHYRAYDWTWKRVSRTARKWPRTAGLIGRGLEVVDRLLMRSGAAPSGKFLLFKRPAPDTGTPPS